MEALRGLYMGVLAALLILAGCLGGGVIDDTEGQDEDTGTDDTGTTVVHNHYYNNTTYESIDSNQPPLVYVHHQGVWYSILSAIDLDGNVTSLGIDVDRDGIADINFTGNFSEVTRYDLPLNGTPEGGVDSPWIIEEVVNGGEGDCYASLNLVAVDDDGASTIVPYSVHYLCSSLGGNQTS